MRGRGAGLAITGAESALIPLHRPRCPKGIRPIHLEPWPQVCLKQTLLISHLESRSSSGGGFPLFGPPLLEGRTIDNTSIMVDIINLP